MLASLLIAAVGGWTLWSLISLYNKYQIAKAIGLPIVVIPVDASNIPWGIGNQVMKLTKPTSALRDILVRRWLPFSYMGWQFDLGHKVVEEIGPAFTLVSPGLVQVVVAEAEAAHELLTRRKDFVKPAVMYEMLEVFGPNVDSVEGETWQRHRRLTAPSFNEKVSASVWSESLQQAGDMLSGWLDRGEHETTVTVHDTATLALHVFTACGFGVQTRFGGKGKASGGHQLTYAEAMFLILRDFVFVLILPLNALGRWYMPKRLRKLGEACNEFQAYVAEMLAKQRSEDGKNTQNTLLSNLVRASDAEKSAQTSTGLSDSEIKGNIFIFSLAGHETTANTLATAIVYLARFPKYQDWLREELKHVLGSQIVQKAAYEATFPNLKRCLAIMYETLRLHGSIVFIPRSTTGVPQVLRVNGASYTIPPQTFIQVNNHATQVNPDTWGKDANEWRPERWIENSKSNSCSDETFFQPKDGALMAWSDGPRVCPGKKFSQVEFVGVTARLFSDHQVKGVGESQAEINMRLDEMLRDSELATATMQMRRPDLVKLQWEKIS